MKQVDKYSQLETKAEKTAYIDKMIDERIALRKERLNFMSAEDKEKRAARRAARKECAPSLNRVKNRVETDDPKEQAKRSEFQIDMRARMSCIMIDQKHRGGLSRWILLFAGLLLISISVACAWWMISNRPMAKRRKPLVLIPKVEIENLIGRDVRVDIPAMGIVIPSKEATLRARVSGEVLKMHKDLEPGGIVRKGEPIIWIDAADYKLQIQMKKAAYKKIETALELEMVQQRMAAMQFKSYGKNKKNSKLDMDMILRKPQERCIRADLMKADADIKCSELNLSRTIIKAPFNAVVLERAVDIGEQADVQRVLVTVVDIDVCWVQVSVPVKSLTWIVFPSKGKKGSLVEITCRRGVRKGRVRRLMISLDSKGRMARVLVEVADPLDQQAKNRKKVPLLLEEYVRVSIQGRIIKDVVRIPRKAYRNNNSIWLMTPEKRLDIVAITPVWSIRDAIYVYRKDIPKGELIVSDLGFPIKGMSISSIKASPSTVHAKSGENK